MKMAAALSALLIAVAGLPVQALAQDIVARANQRTVLGGWIIYDRNNCGHAGKPKVTMSGPSHGKMEVVWTPMTLGNDAGSCRGKPARGMGFIYTPDKGYRGSDEVKIGLRAYYSGTASYYHDFKFKITVK